MVNDRSHAVAVSASSTRNAKIGFPAFPGFRLAVIGIDFLKSRLTVLALFSLLLPAGVSGAELSTRLTDSDESYRVPIDIVFQRHGQQDAGVFTANSRTGSISRISASSELACGEWKIAASLSGLAGWRGHLLALDDSDHQLCVLRYDVAADQMLKVAAHRLAEFPVDIAVSSDERHVAVTSLWSRRVTLFSDGRSDSSSASAATDGDDVADRLTVSHIVDLPFSPRRLIFLPDGHLLVADAFGGRTVVIDVMTAESKPGPTVYGHNIRGLAFSSVKDSLLVSCQTLDPNTVTTYERVFWGVLMRNDLHALPRKRIAALYSGVGTASEQGAKATDRYTDELQSDSSSATSAYTTSVQTYPLGTPSIGSGDPGEMIVTSADTTLLLISGTDQLAFRTASHLPFERISTGRRPESICIDDREQYAFIANRFEDTVTVVRLTGDAPAVHSTIRLGAVRPLTTAEKGEQLFYDARVSLDGWFSCHSCHTDGHTNGKLADTFGDEDRGAPKKVLSLLGSAATGPWAWNGSKSTLEDQIRTSLILSMQSQIPSQDLPVDSLAAYLRSLSPAPALAATTGRKHSPDLITRGHRLFRDVGCQSCHDGDQFTSSGRYDVGIHDEMGGTHFNPPSLRGVSQRAPYFHDGRADTLRDVLKTSHHDSDCPLTDDELDALIAMLETL